MTTPTNGSSSGYSSNIFILSDQKGPITTSNGMLTDENHSVVGYDIDQFCPPVAPEIPRVSSGVDSDGCTQYSADPCAQRAISDTLAAETLRRAEELIASSRDIASAQAKIREAEEALKRDADTISATAATKNQSSWLPWNW